MDVFQITLITTTFLVSMVAGFLFAFTVVVMPGIKNLSDRNFLQAFKEMDSVIQTNQPLFMIVWVGSILSSILLLVQSFLHFNYPESLILIILLAFYFICTQVPTIVINIPLNNRLKNMDIEIMEENSIKKVRADFESRWNRSNKFRTLSAVLTSLALIIFLSSHFMN
tara:strand:+ start:34941 stop:35444 length:504 start_codon:yes stop_codon:yes gene_type:complete